MFIVYTYHNLLSHSSTDGHLSHFHLWKWKKMKVAQSCPTLCYLMDCPWNSPGQNTGVGSLFLLQGIFPTQESNLGLLHCRKILYQLSHKGSPSTWGLVRILLRWNSPNKRKAARLWADHIMFQALLKWQKYQFNKANWSAPWNLGQCSLTFL